MQEPELVPEEGEIDEEVAELERLRQEARAARAAALRPKLAELNRFLARYRVRHVTKTQSKPGRRNKGTAKRVRHEVAGRLPHFRYPRPARRSDTYKRKSLCNMRQRAGFDRRREQDRQDAEELIWMELPLDVLDAAPGDTEEQAIQTMTRRLMEARSKDGVLF